MITIEKLIADLSDLQVTTQEEQTALEAYQGYSWGYAGGHLIESRQLAAERFGKSLNEYIDQRIQMAMNQSVRGITSTLR